MKTLKVNSLLATSIAERVIEKVKSNRKMYLAEVKKQLHDSKELKKLKELRKEITRITTQANAIESKLEKGTDQVQVSIYSSGEFRVFERETNLKNKTVRQDVIFASHVEGIPFEKLVDHVAKKYR